MNGRSWEAVERVLDAALSCDPSEWPDLVETMCAGNAELRREAFSLLACHDAARGFLESPALVALGQPPLETPGPAASGQRVGPYRIVREIGSGGMGCVYLAERADGRYERQVAIKFLDQGLDESAARRFLAEGRILASLSHPNIARLLDGGVTGDGRPYLVMEHVAGRPITDYCDARRLGVRERLRLFLSVCDAVAHAHRNLVVHRDLKPANILATDAGEVKLLDFGIARLLEPGPGARAVAPATTGVLLMTPEYASPEQVRGERLTTASDVYSLGLLLYQLLAGEPPYRLPSRAPHEIVRLVCEEEPEPPSARLLRSAGEPGTLKRLGRALRGDLDAIVATALRKEPGHRYPSADALAADLRRHLDGLPVLARRGGGWYRARRFLRRRWLEAAAAAVVALALLVGSGVAYWHAAAADRERARAEAALHRSEDVTTFLMGIFEESDPALVAGDTVAARELLRRGVRQVEALSGQPLVQARMLDVLGGIYMNLGRYDDAEPLVRRGLELRRAQLGDVHPEVAESLVSIGRLERLTARWPEAGRTYRHALEIQRRTLGPADTAMATTLLGLAQAVVLHDLEAAEQAGREALAIRRAALGPDHPLVSQVAVRLGTVLRRSGRDDEAEAFYRRALAGYGAMQGLDAPDAAEPMLHLADLLRTRPADRAEAESLYRQALDIRRRHFGDVHPELVHGLHGLASLHLAREDFAAAETLQREALALKRGVYGPRSVRVANTTALLAETFVRQGRLAEAESLIRESLAILDSTVGREHTATAGILGALGSVAASQARYDEAEAHFREALAIRERLLGPDAGAVGMAWLELGRALRSAGRSADAEDAFGRAHAILHRYGGEHHPQTATARTALRGQAERL